MLFDTDVMIWALRGNKKAAACIDETDILYISAVSYMELLKGARSKNEQKAIKVFLRDLRFEHLPLTEAISHRAVIYVEEFALSSGLELADALIASTACEQGIDLCTANDKHYRAVSDLSIHVFRP